MTMLRTGSSGDDGHGSQEIADSYACERCGGHGTACECAPCDACALVVNPSSLTWAADGRWRCPACHLRAEVKVLCGEHKAWRPSMADFYCAVVREMLAKRCCPKCGGSFFSCPCVEAVIR
jgi:hypothetical protein